MIKVLGTKRVLGLVFLLAINAAFASGLYLFVMPEKAKKERELRGLQGEISTAVSDIDRLQIEFEQLEKQQEQFDGLRARGFFSNQERRQAEKVFQRVQNEAGVVSAVANVQAGKIEENEEAAKADHKILSSPVTIRLSAMDDVDVFRYIYLVEQFFPGHVTINNIHLERTAEISGTILRGIASGANPELVKAEIEMTWRTMIPASEVIGAPPPEQTEGGAL